MNTCICCGAIIPEGRQVCPICEGTAVGKMITKQKANPKSYKDWTLAEAKAFCAERGQARKDGYDPCEKCPLWAVLCAPEYPEKWNLNGFTPEEVEAAKAVKVLFPTAQSTYVCEHDPIIRVFDAAGEVIHAFIEDRNPFPSLKKGETVKLDDIIGEG